MIWSVTDGRAFGIVVAMTARHDVKDLGMAAVKLPDGQELELPLLQVIFSIRNEFGRWVHLKFIQLVNCI